MKETFLRNSITMYVCMIWLWALLVFLRWGGEPWPFSNLWTSTLRIPNKPCWLVRAKVLHPFENIACTHLSTLPQLLKNNCFLTSQDRSYCMHGCCFLEINWSLNIILYNVYGSLLSICFLVSWWWQQIWNYYLVYLFCN